MTIKPPNNQHSRTWPKRKRQLPAPIWLQIQWPNRSMERAMNLARPVTFVFASNPFRRHLRLRTTLPNWMSPHLSRCSDHHVRDTHWPRQLRSAIEAPDLQQRHPSVPSAGGRG